MAKLLHATRSGAIEPADIVKTTHEALNHFDTAAAVQYRAYHKD